MTEIEEPLEAEFDTVASWTEEIVSRLGPEYAIPAACRGSANPAWLTWIADRLALGPKDRLLDAGSGLGGPGAWLSREYSDGLMPVLAEPMVGACRASRAMFGLPTVCAWSQSLPFADAAFDVAWCLGVLCTTSDKPGLLKEVRRVLGSRGRLGLLVLVQVSAQLTDAPEGNDFPSGGSLLADLSASGFAVQDRIEVSAIEATDDAWQRRVDQVDAALAERFGARPAWQLAQEQERRIGRLLRQGDLETWLITASVTS